MKKQNYTKSRLKRKVKTAISALALLFVTVGGFAACEAYEGPNTGTTSSTEQHEHEWNRHYIFIAPTEDTDGEILYVCEDCKLVKMEKIMPDGDEDGDLLTNYEEIVIYNTDSYLEDTDGDHLLDGEEINLFYTDPTKYDSDNDGLCDFDEFIYETDPMNPDTDSDGLYDGKEIEYGFDPKKAEDTFSVTITPDESVEDKVFPSLDIETEGDVLNTLKVKPDDFFTEDTLGYVGKAYAYESEGAIQSAKITFTFDETAVAEDAELVIYSFNAEKRELTPLDTTVEDGQASAEVSELSTYILLDRRVYETEFKWVDKWDISNIYSQIEIVFVIDDSGSMTSNDPTDERLIVVKDLVDKLPNNSQVSIISFGATSQVLTGLTENKETAKGYLTNSYFTSNGSSTYMYSAVNTAFNQFESLVDEEVMKVIILISDGEAHDTGLHSSVVSQAQAKDVMVYTVGLGSSSSSYFTSYLKPLAEDTGAKFYLSSEATELASIYGDIKEKIDLLTDNDNDGLIDYYEDNMVIFSGIGYELDKNNADTDSDGLLDGVEVKTVTMFNDDGTKMTILGRVFSDPTKADSDNDGVEDKMDKYPLNSSKS